MCISSYGSRRSNGYSEALNSGIHYSLLIEEYNMGGHIPKTIKINVLKKWLEGLSIDKIAGKEGIATGSVNIIQECRQNDPEFDLMREVAVKLKDQGDTIESFASTVRLRERIRKILQLPSSPSSSLDRITTTTKNRKEVEESTIVIEHDKIESFIESLEVFCFKHNLSIKEFIDLVYRLAFIAYNKFRIPLENLPDCVQQLEGEADTLTEQIAEKKLEMKNVLAYYDGATTLEYNANRSSLFEENKRLREELVKVSKQRDMYFRDAMEFAISLEEGEDDTNRN